MAFIHELPTWPGFTWDEAALLRPLGEVRQALGEHLGRMRSIGADLRVESRLEAMATELVRSWAIEGEDLDLDAVRSSFAGLLGLEVGGLPPSERRIDAIVEVHLDAIRTATDPLAAERILSWHAALFPTGWSNLRRIEIGTWRSDAKGPMQVVSGRPGRERVHFEAPAATRLPEELDRFLAWFNAAPDLDLILRAGLAHLWFLTLHPLDDGNGRIARALCDGALAAADGSPERFYSLSAQVDQERSEYYVQLESAQRGSMDVTAWLQWFLGCLGRALASSEELLAGVLRKDRFWRRAEPHGLGERQRKVLTRLLGDFEGHLTTAKYAKLTKCSHDTALRDIKALIATGLLVQNPAGGRSTSYRLPDEG